MTLHDQDTDPSTPGSHRPPGSRAASTDPGVGPPSQVSDSKPTGVVVPPPGPGAGPVAVFASASRPKDSVELLLEGMAGPRPDRVKTMPRTSGEGSAAYHVEHAVHAAHTFPDEQPKVMVERGQVEARDATDPPGFRLPIVEVPPGWRAADPTYVPPRPIGPRIAVATLAGLLVVGGIVMSLDRRAQSPVVAAPPSVLSAPPTMPVDPVLAMTSAPVVEPPVQPASESAPESATAPAPALASAPPRAAKARPRPSAPAGDLGEFKTTF